MAANPWRNVSYYDRNCNWQKSIAVFWCPAKKSRNYTEVLYDRMSWKAGSGERGEVRWSSSLAWRPPIVAIAQALSSLRVDRRYRDCDGAKKTGTNPVVVF